MTDREKVIKWLEECQKPECTCKNCPYYLVVDESAMDEAVLEHCTDQLMRDALTLLREQTRWVEETDRRNHYHCESCGYTAGIVARTYKYCPECGRAVKWDA
jgi:protein-arginine kinase activator protein McsA